MRGRREIPSVKSFDRTGNVFIFGTFSKIFCPGYRIGWVAGDREAIKKYRPSQAGGGICSCNTLAQREIMKWLELFDLESHIEKIRAVYKKRRDVMVSVMEKEFPEAVNVYKAAGRSLFAWAELPAHIDAQRAADKKASNGTLPSSPAGRFSQRRP